MKLYFNNDICPKCGNLTDHYHNKICSDCRRAQIRSYNKAHKAELNAYNKTYNKNNRTVIKEYKKVYDKAHAEERKVYRKSKLNSNNDTLDNVRNKSRYYLFNTLNHTKLDNYEVHHCFSYDDYAKFIYIPKSLHLKIHQYLRDNKIDAKAEHYKYIVDMINECTEYTYIHV